MRSHQVKKFEKIDPVIQDIVFDDLFLTFDEKRD